MNRSAIDTLRGVLVVALLVLRGQDIRAQALPSASLPDAAHSAAPSPPGSDWTGVYVGAPVGVSRSRSTWWETEPGAPSLSGSLSLVRPYNIFDGSGSQFGGVEVGYNHRVACRMLIGFEGEVSFAAEPVVSAVPFSDATELFGTARARIGYVPHRSLYYATGGLGWTR